MQFAEISLRLNEFILLIAQSTFFFFNFNVNIRGILRPKDRAVKTPGGNVSTLLTTVVLWPFQLLEFVLFRDVLTMIGQC